MDGTDTDMACAKGKELHNCFCRHIPGNETFVVIWINYFINAKTFFKITRRVSCCGCGLRPVET